METIFHEKQEGSLCAQHCLNALLQGHYFTAVDLAAIGQQLDESERETMAEAGIHSEEYRKFLEQPSSNYDDSGFFSVQVIQNALRVWSLEQIPFKSSDPVAVNAQQDPTKMKAFICNFKEHWFCVRKLGNQWFNLNSLLTGPELISDTYLAIFLAQLQQEGYSIFIILGSLPDCEADQLLRLMPAVQPVKPQLLTDVARGQEGQGQDAMTGEEDQDEMARVLEESRQMQNDAEALELEAAIALSMQGSSQAQQPNPASSPFPGPSTSRDQLQSAPGPVSDTQPSMSELREKRLAYLQNTQGPATQNRQTTEASQSPDEKTEEELLQEAIKISLQSPK